jgi:hypothetical protein
MQSVERGKSKDLADRLRTAKKNGMKRGSGEPGNRRERQGKKENQAAGGCRLTVMFEGGIQGHERL